MNNSVTSEVIGGNVGLLTMNRPDSANAVVPELALAMVEHLRSLESDFSIRSVVLTGAGRHFSAGADLDGLVAYLSSKLQSEHEPYNMRVLAPLTVAIMRSRLPIVAAMNGAATAGGLDLAMACDLRVAGESSRLGETYVKIGAAPANGGSYFLPRLVGMTVASEMALTGDLIDARQALEWRLVNRVVPDDQVVPEALKLAFRIAQHPWRALEATKQALRASWNEELEGNLNRSHWVTGLLSHTDQFQARTSAAHEHREPSSDDREELLHWQLPPSGETENPDGRTEETR